MLRRTRNACGGRLFWSRYNRYHLTSLSLSHFLSFLRCYAHICFPHSSYLSARPCSSVSCHYTRHFRTERSVISALRSEHIFRNRNVRFRSITLLDSAVHRSVGYNGLQSQILRYDYGIYMLLPSLLFLSQYTSL